MSGVCLLITSSPTSPEGRQALELAEALYAASDALTLCALQDAVVLACRKQPDATRQVMERLLARGVTLCVLNEDLALRGLTAMEMLEPVVFVSYREIASRLADEQSQVIGCL
jgi:sulfur relay protein TusB/DsrH